VRAQQFQVFPKKIHQVPSGLYQTFVFLAIDFHFNPTPLGHVISPL
jgi:hypothetical protein